MQLLGYPEDLSQQIGTFSLSMLIISEAKLSSEGQFIHLKGKVQILSEPDVHVTPAFPERLLEDGLRGRKSEKGAFASPNVCLFST